MANAEKLSIALTPEMAAMVRRAVEGGDFASASEVIRDALREWQRRRAERAAAMAALGRLWDEGIESGPSVDGPKAFARVRAALGAKRREPKPARERTVRRRARR